MTTSDSVAGFLDHAKANRVLFPEQVEQLIRQPDLPHANLTSLCEYLLTRGVLTRFQADAIRERRADDLSFGGYPVIDIIGPCPGGTAYRVLHPSLRTSLVLRRMRIDWLPPGDSPAGFVERAKSLGMLPHPNVVHLLDAGCYRDELYLVFDLPGDAVDLQTLTQEIGGAMPGFLAAEYGHAVASVLRLVHERGGVHGDVRPAHLLVGPLVVKTGEDGRVRRRPAPNAIVRLAELGTVPAWPGPVTANSEPTVTAYLPPERLEGRPYDPRGDIYALGATLYFLLAGRPPFPDTEPHALIEQIRSINPAPLATLRPDLPAELADLVTRMMHKVPNERPATMADVETALTPFCRASALKSETVPEAVAASSSLTSAAVPVAEPAEVWGVSSGAFSMSSVETAPLRREPSPRDRRRRHLLIALGGLLHLTGIALFIAFVLGVFSSTPEAPPNTKPSTKDTVPIKKKKSISPDS